jgi:superfamily II DNA/RNA helicase
MQLRNQWNLVRQVVAHPASLVRGRGEVAQRIVAEVGEEALMRIGSAKVDAMLAWARSVGEQSGVIFTFYGPSCIPILAPELTRAGFTVATYHSGLSAERRWEEKQAFKRGEYQFLLCSDAARRGENLGRGSVLLHYEPPLDFDTYDQRNDRIHRLGSPHDSVTVDCLVARDTPDVHAYGLVTKRQEWTQQVIDAGLEDVDPAAGVVTAEMRRRMLAEIKYR